MNEVITKTPEQLQREELVRQVLENAARKVEELTGNPTYQQAWRIACRTIRALKP